MREELFEELIKGLTRKVNFERYPENIFFFRGNECWFRYDLNLGYLWCHREKVWKFLECKGLYNYHEIKSFIKKQVEEHFKLMEVTPAAPRMPIM